MPLPPLGYLLYWYFIPPDEFQSLCLFRIFLLHKGTVRVIDFPSLSASPLVPSDLFGFTINLNFKLAACALRAGKAHAPHLHHKYSEKGKYFPLWATTVGEKLPKLTVSILFDVINKINRNKAFFPCVPVPIKRAVNECVSQCRIDTFHPHPVASTTTIYYPHFAVI